ncbi:MAG: 50S ribosomal protein L29 [Myxococcales bacterium]|nr:50S ribosomal protein L29 [Myxococcales bacterium]
MKPLNSKDLRNMGTDELEKLNQERRRQAFDLRFQHYTGQLHDSAALRVNRRDIARIETILRERQLASKEA